jgi:hypothetical protein
VLRGPDDKTIHPDNVVTPADLKYPQPPPEVKREELPPPTADRPFAAPPPIRIFKGSQEVTNQ